MSHRFASRLPRSAAAFTPRARRAFLTSTLIALSASSGLAQALSESTLAANKKTEEVVHLDKVQVTAARDDALVPIAAAAEKLAEIPGTVSVVDLADVRRGRAANAEDLLSYLPGVYAAATSGNSANKISIRGSGLNTFYQGYSLGTKYLNDGQPITGPGGTQEELLATASPSFVEILNGPNAFAYASTSLGGAINFVTHTGYTAPGLQTRFEAGSFGYLRGELSYGRVSGKFDYYVSLSQNERDGFQVNTPNEGNSAVVNLGYRINDRLDTRLIVRFQREELYNGSTLTKQQIADDPSQNNTIGLARTNLAIPGSPRVIARGAQSARKKQGSTVVTSKTTYLVDDASRIEFGLSNTNYPLENGWLFSNTPQDWRSNDLNVTLRYLREDEFFGLNSKTTTIISDTRLIFGDVHGYADPRNGTGRTLTQYTKYNGSRDTVFAIGNDLELIATRLWLTTGLSYAELDRAVRIVYSTAANNPTTNPAGYPTQVNYVDRSFLPRAGLRYAVTRDVQIFGSVSKAVDAPVTWQIGSTGNPFARPLRPQEATTVEIGTRGKWTIFDGSLTFYRASLEDELLTVRVDGYPTSDPRGSVNANASPTIHQGAELGFNTLLWSEKSSEKGSKLSLRQAYTLNDFYFENDPTYGRKDLPSIPAHVYQAELLYQHAKGFYVGTNIRYASDYYVDFANTVKADAYTLYGAKIGYETPRWSVFVDLRNITDEHYAAAANTTDNRAGFADNATNFYPGDTFNLIGGVSLRF